MEQEEQEQEQEEEFDFLCPTCKPEPEERQEEQICPLKLYEDDFAKAATRGSSNVRHIFPFHALIPGGEVYIHDTVRLIHSERCSAKWACDLIKLGRGQLWYCQRSLEILRAGLENH